MTTRAWKPLLSGRLAEESCECARQIAEACCRVEIDTPSLASGAAGVALALAQFGPDSAYGVTVERLIDAAAQFVSRRPLGPALFDGFVGVAWAVDRIEAGVLGSAEGDTCDEIDSAVLQALEDWQGHFDLVSGLAGLGVYALERLDRPFARRALARIVQHLGERAVEANGGIAWETPPASFPSVPVRTGFDLGVAHGVPGLLPLLASCAALDIEATLASTLCEGAVDFLLAQRLPEEECARFAYSTGGTDRWRAAARVAWCYGDLGISLALLSAARLLRRADWERDALSIARRAARRRPSNDGVVDAGICHGAAGNAHLFNRLYQATRDEVLRSAAIEWFERTLSMRVPGEGVAGVRAFVSEIGDQWKGSWSAVPGLLDGAAGVSLALLSASSDAEPAWDRFLCAAPPAPVPSPARGARPVDGPRETTG